MVQKEEQEATDDTVAECLPSCAKTGAQGSLVEASRRRGMAAQADTWESLEDGKVQGKFRG